MLPNGENAQYKFPVQEDISTPTVPKPKRYSVYKYKKTMAAIPYI